MRLFIPTINQILQLEKEWKVELQDESRNSAMIKKHGKDITFPVGTKFAVDRIYIRKGLPKYDSVTFRIITEPKGRFWVKLEKANEIEFNPVESKITTHSLYKNSDLIVKTSSKSALVSKIKNNSYNYETGKSIPDFFELFYEEVVPLMTDWIIHPDYKGQNLYRRDFSTNVRDKTLPPLIAPTDVSKFNTLSKETLKHNKHAGTTIHETFYGGTYPVRYDECFYFVEPYETRDAFLKDFMSTLKKLKGVKSEAALLNHLPKGYEYKEETK